MPHRLSIGFLNLALALIVWATAAVAQPLDLPYGTILPADAPPSGPLAETLALDVDPPPASESRYAWYDPRSVLSLADWDGTIEFGLNGSEGNSESLSLLSGLELSRETAWTNWDLDLTYAKTESGGVETQHFAILWSDWDLRLKNPKWSWFVKKGLTYDEFKNFDLRLLINTGLGYLLVDTPVNQFRPRFGGGVSYEVGGIEDVIPEAVFGFDYAYKFNDAQKLSIVHDCFPDWSNFSDFRQLTDAGWEILLSEATGLSLKLGVIHRYDSTPDGTQKSDLAYNVLLIWAL